MMKCNLVIFFLMLLAGSPKGFGQSGCEESNFKVNAIQIRITPMDICTAVAITPEQFDKGALRQVADTVNVFDSSEINHVLDAIDEVTVQDTIRLSHRIDTRGSIRITYANKVHHSIYFNMFYLERGSQDFWLTQQFKDAINATIFKRLCYKLF